MLSQTFNQQREPAAIYKIPIKLINDKRQNKFDFSKSQIKLFPHQPQNLAFASALTPQRSQIFLICFEELD